MSYRGEDGRRYGDRADAFIDSFRQTLPDAADRAHAATDNVEFGELPTTNGIIRLLSAALRQCEGQLREARRRLQDTRCSDHLDEPNWKTFYCTRCGKPRAYIVDTGFTYRELARRATRLHHERDKWKAAAVQGYRLMRAVEEAANYRPINGRVKSKHLLSLVRRYREGAP